MEKRKSCPKETGKDNIEEGEFSWGAGLSKQAKLE
jgi:hypothetical protein